MDDAHRSKTPNMAETLIERWRKGTLGKDEIDRLAFAGQRYWWAWDALRAIAPERVSFPRPKRPKGRDATDNVVRDIRIYFEVEHLVASGLSIRAASREVDAGWPMLGPKAIEGIYRKERNRLKK